MNPILQVESVFGGYSIAKPFLQNITFEVNRGEIVGMIGLNGAGKSTTIKHILGLMLPQQGHVKVNGVTLGENAEKYRSSYTYVPETPLLYEELSVEEHLRFAAMAYGVEQSAYEERLGTLAEQFQMKDKLNRLSGHLSKGMRQKVMIMSSFLVQPQLYIIDEPFLGLDPLGIRTLLDRMVERKRAGASILLSSHILATIERYCDKFVLLHEGRMLAYGGMDDLRRQANLPGASLDDLFERLVGGA